MTLNQLRRIIKYWFQRRCRGWDDGDTWSLDCTMAALMLPRLRRLRKIGKTVAGPSSVFLPKDFNFSESTESQEEAWIKAGIKQEQIFDDIEYFLQQYSENGNMDLDDRAKKGRRQLIRYVDTMWW